MGLGDGVECSARLAAAGSILMCQSFLDGAITRTISLASINGAGQKMRQIDSDWTRIAESELAANTASVTVTLVPGEFFTVVAPNNYALEFPMQQMCVRIADGGPSANKAVLVYAYTEFPFSQPAVIGSQMLYQAVDLGATGCASVPLDRSVGSIYGYVVYLNSSGVPITSPAPVGFPPTL
jgi:hypothetical protein